MSIALMTDVWKINLQSAKKMVLLALADSANDEGTNCFPSIATIVEKCSMGERTVFRHLVSLEEVGLISRHERPGRSTNYVLNIAEIQRLVTKKRGRSPSAVVDNPECGTQVIHNTTGSDTPANLAGVPANPHSTHTPANLAPLSNWHPPLPIWHPTPANLAPITTTEPSLNHNNLAKSYPQSQTDSELPRGCGDDSQNPKTELAWPSCSVEDKAAIDGLLAALPPEQHQTLLDEVEGARAAGKIRLGLVPFAGALVRAMLNGTFTPGHSPVVAARRREKTSERDQAPIARTLPDISAKDLARGQAVLSKILGQSDPKQSSL